MMMKEFANEKYLVLEQIFKHQNEHLTQESLGHFLSFSRRKVNEIMQDLKQHGYIEKVQNGQYKVTKKGNEVVKKFMEV